MLSNIYISFKHYFNTICLWILSLQQSNINPDLTVLTSSCLNLFCYTTAHTITDNNANGFDSDSFIILIDNCCSACVTNELTDFEGVPTKVNSKVKGIGGAIYFTHKGTIRWSFQDDKGVSHTFLIKDSYYAKNTPCRLLSPQHWSQNSGDNSVVSKGTWSATYDDRVELHWGRNTYHRTVMLDSSSNIAFIRSTPGYRNYKVFIAVADCFNIRKTNSPYCFTGTMLKDDSDDEIEDANLADDATVPTTNTTSGRTQSKEVDFNDNTVVVDNLDHEPRTATMEASTELLLWHYRHNHLPFSSLQLMAKNGNLPKRLAGCRIPKCAACLYGKNTRQPWRTKGKSNRTIKMCTVPGQCVSVDQLESPIPGLIAQMKGIPTVTRYKAATIFVDHFSRLSYIHLQPTLSSEDTVKAKQAFEHYAASYGVGILHYHADNGRFADKLFLQSVEDQQQTITFCGVNAHFQNGIAEKRIQDIQDLAQTAMLHASSNWPTAFSSHLWPYALRCVNETLICAPKRKDGLSAMNLFSGTTVLTNIRSFHPFGCPVYVLHNTLQARIKISKWDSHSRLGLYLGPSPRHARSVGLVLNLRTGLVSPQFHMKFDDYFETVMFKKDNADSE